MDCTHVLVDESGPVGTLSVTFTGRRDEAGGPLFAWSVTDAEGNLLGQDQLVLDGDRQPVARKAMGRLIAQLIATAGDIETFLHRGGPAFAAPFFEEPEVRSFAYRHLEQLQEAGEEFDSRGVLPVF